MKQSAVMFHPDGKGGWTEQELCRYQSTEEQPRRRDYLYYFLIGSGFIALLLIVALLSGALG